MSPLARPPKGLEGFPSHHLQAGRPLYRSHRHDRAPWFFASSLAGRFDLPPPRGTCHAATEPLAAFLEVFRDTALVAVGDVERRRLARLAAGEELRLADCTAESARRFGVTAAIHSSPDHPLTQAWAAAFAEAGFDGVRYLASHDPSQRLEAVALFGREGAAVKEGGRWRVEESGPIPEGVRLEAFERFGILVVPTP